MSEAREQVGKIRLSAIAAEWSDTQTLNPRLLAGEVAFLLRTLPANQVLDERVASAILYDPVAGAGGVTHGALADYFEAVSQGAPPETITTSTGQVRAAVVFIARHWIDKAVNEATQRAAAVAGFVTVANDVASFAIMASGAPARLEAPAPPPSGSAPGYLQMRQAQQRQAGEKSAAEQLDAALSKDKTSERENAELLAAIAIKDAQITALRAEVENKDREVSTGLRAKLKAEDDAIALEEKLEQVMGLAEFMNPENKLSPVIGRQMVACWIYLTNSGVYDVVSATGRGLSRHCEAWLEAREVIPAGKVRMFTTVLGWQSRKKGGAVAKQGKENL